MGSSKEHLDGDVGFWINVGSDPFVVSLIFFGLQEGMFLVYDGLTTVWVMVIRNLVSVSMGVVIAVGSPCDEVESLILVRV